MDVNDNFRWATAHIAALRRENVEGVSVYNLLKHHQIVFTEPALTKLIQMIHGYPKTRGWGQRFATPDGKPAPIPEKVTGWNQVWIEKKERLRNAQFRQREFFHEAQKWKWSHELKGPLKIPRHDALAGFRVKDFIANHEKPVWEKFESLYVDDEPLEEEPEDDEFDDLMMTLQENFDRAEFKRSDLIENPEEIEQMELSALASGQSKTYRRLTAAGKRSARVATSSSSDLDKQHVQDK